MTRKGSINIGGMEKSLMRFVYFLVAIASVFIIILGIQSSAYVINSILLAAMITIGVLPVTRWLIERGWRPSLSLILTLLLVVAVIGLVLFLMYASLSGLTTEPATPAPVGEAGDSQGQPETLFGRVQELVSGGDASQVLADVAGWVGQVLSQSITVLMIFMFMLSASAVTPISDQLEKVGGNPTLDVVSDLTADVQQYLSITTLVNFTVGLVDAIFLWAMGIENAILWGIMAWIFGYIPVVGFWFAMIPPLLIAWNQYGLSRALVILIGYALINGSVENFIKPKIMGEQLKMSPLVIFVSLIFWGWVLGGPGAILAVPLTMIMLSILNSFDATRWLVVLARSSPGEEHEKEQARHRLRDLWSSAPSGDSEEVEEVGDGPKTRDGGLAE